MHTPKTHSLKKDPLFYGWVIVALGALITFFSSPGQAYSISIFIDTYIDAYGWSRSLVSTYFSIATLVAGFSLPWIGRFIDRQGHRRATPLMALLLGFACFWFSFVERPLMLLGGFFFIRLFGQGALFLLPQTLIPQWFNRHRGKALSIVSIGFVAGSTFAPPINTVLIERFGAPTTWIAWGAALILILAPLSLLFLRNHPAEVGQVIDGAKPQDKEEDPRARYDTVIPLDQPSWTLREAMGTRSFWLMLFNFAAPIMIYTGMTFHMVSVVESKGFTPGFAALLLSLTALIQFPSTFIAGLIVDKVQVHLFKGAYTLLLGIGIAALLFGQTRGTLLIYSVVLGIFLAFNNVSTGVLWPNYYGLKHLSEIRSVASMAMVIGSAIGPLLMGLAYDRFQGYTEILTIFLLVPLLASLAAFASPPPVHRSTI